MPVTFTLSAGARGLSMVWPSAVTTATTSSVCLPDLSGGKGESHSKRPAVTAGNGQRAARRECCRRRLRNGK